MKSDGRHKVDVLEAAETLPPGNVPQSDGLVHGGGEQEEVLQGPQQHRRVRAAILKWPIEAKKSRRAQGIVDSFFREKTGTSGITTATA